MLCISASVGEGEGFREVAGVRGFKTMDGGLEGLGDPTTADFRFGKKAGN